MDNLRQTKDDGGTVLLSNEPSQFPLTFLHCFLVLLAHSWVALSHISTVNSTCNQSFQLSTIKLYKTKANWTQNWSYLVVDHELQTLLVYCTMRWLKRHELNTSLSSFCSRARKWDIFIEREPKEDSSARFGPLALFTLDRAAKIELYFQLYCQLGPSLLSGSWKGQLAGQRLDTCAWDYGCQVIHSLLVRRAPYFYLVN